MNRSSNKAIQRTLHIDCANIPFIPFEPGLFTRVIHARPDENFVATEIRAEPGVVGRLHRHLGPVMGYTTTGAWGHEQDFSYRRGTYVYETPGVVHRFLSSPRHETQALFMSHGDLEWIDAETGEVTAILSSSTVVGAYFERCEALGIARPNILS